MVGGVVLTLLVVLVVRSSSKTGSHVATTGPALLAPPGDPDGAAVDGISCEPMESVLFHIHAHIAVFVGTQERIIPAGIGVTPPRQIQQTVDGPYVSAGACFYWLHSHTEDGIIHIESPIQRVYTLGDYFDIWHQPLSQSQVGPDHGTVVTYVDGHLTPGDPRTVPLTAHGLIQLDVNSTTPPQPFTFPAGL